MTRVCVIGNSHVASLRNGMDDIGGSFPDVSVTFFAHRGRKICDLEVVDGVLAPLNEDLKVALSHTSGGHEVIDFKLFDLCLVHGMMEAYHVRDGFYSSAVMRQALADHVEASPLWRLLRQIRQVSDLPLYVGPVPLPARPSGPEEKADAGRYVKGISLLNDAVFKKYDARLLAQPEETMAGEFNTRRQYSAGSTRLDIGDDKSGERHPDSDCLHMNGRFGALWLREFLSRHLGIGGMAPTASRAEAVGHAGVGHAG